jgi:hypothetical protein
MFMAGATLARASVTTNALCRVELGLNSDHLLSSLHTPQSGPAAPFKLILVGYLYREYTIVLVAFVFCELR